MYVNYSIISKVLIFATIIRWNKRLLFVCHSFLIESSFFSPLTWIILSQNSIRLSLFNLNNIFTPTKLLLLFFFNPLVSLSILNDYQIFSQFHTVSKIITSRENKQKRPFATKKHYDSSSNVESPQLKNQTPGKCGSHLHQSNPFAKNPHFLYQTSLQDLSPSLFSLVLISRNNTSLSFPFSLRWVLLLFYFFACYVELIYNIYGRFV